MRHEITSDAVIRVVEQDSHFDLLSRTIDDTVTTTIHHRVVTRGTVAVEEKTMGLVA